MSTDVIVIVDGWNLRSQARDVLGTRRHPTASGIVAALAPYGLSVVEIHYALGVDNANGRRSGHLDDALESNNKQMRAIAADPLVTPLRGKLVERDEPGGGTRIEEKHIDVMCALAVASAVTRIREGKTSARAIVVISEDMDFEPAYAYAEKFGVRVYAAANETIHHRSGRWLLLGEWALQTMLEPPRGIKHSSSLRSSVCRFAHYFDQALVTFKAGRFDSGSGTRTFRNRDGVVGVLACGPDEHQVGESASFYAVDVDLGDRRDAFPQLVLDHTPRGGACPDMVEAEIVDWMDPTRARITYQNGGGQTSIGMPLGVYPPSSTVLIHAPAHRRAVLIGAGQPPARKLVWEDLTKPRQVKVTTAQVTGGTVQAVMVASGTKVTMRVFPGLVVAENDQFAAIPVTLAAGAWEVMPVSSCLPDPA